MLSKRFFLKLLFILLAAILFIPSNRANEGPAGTAKNSFAWSNETIDEFARNNLFAPKADKELPPPLNGPVSNRKQRFDVLYISAQEGELPRAYLLIDYQYGKLVKKGDHLREWQIKDVGEDFVDIAHTQQSKRTERLLLESNIDLKAAHNN